MMKRTNFLSALFAVSLVCLVSAASYSQSPQTAEITAGRAQALVAAGVGLISLIIGGLALARSAGLIGKGSGRAGAIIALLLGLIGIVLSVVHIAGSTGFGTGGGRAGAIVALVLSLIGTSLGGLTLLRSPRSVSSG